MFYGSWRITARGSDRPTLDNTALDRLVYNGCRIELKGESMRKRATKLTKKEGLQTNNAKLRRCARHDECAKGGPIAWHMRQATTKPNDSPVDTRDERYFSALWVFLIVMLKGNCQCSLPLAMSPIEVVCLQPRKIVVQCLTLTSPCLRASCLTSLQSQIH